MEERNFKWEMKTPTLAEIKAYIKEHFIVTANGRIEPKVKGPSLIIIDYIDKLK